VARRLVDQAEDEETKVAVTKRPATAASAPAMASATMTVSAAHCHFHVPARAAPFSIASVHIVSFILAPVAAESIVIVQKVA
jgi:hypothetical protein